eukprot:403364747
MGNCCTKVTSNSRIDHTVQRRAQARRSIINKGILGEMEYYQEGDNQSQKHHNDLQPIKKQVHDDQPSPKHGQTFNDCDSQNMTIDQSRVFENQFGTFQTDDFKLGTSGQLFTQNFNNNNHNSVTNSMFKQQYKIKGFDAQGDESVTDIKIQQVHQNEINIMKTTKTKDNQVVSGVYTSIKVTQQLNQNSDEQVMSQSFLVEGKQIEQQQFMSQIQNQVDLCPLQKQHTQDDATTNTQDDNNNGSTFQNPNESPQKPVHIESLSILQQDDNLPIINRNSSLHSDHSLEKSQEGSARNLSKHDNCKKCKMSQAHQHSSQSQFSKSIKSSKSSKNSFIDNSNLKQFLHQKQNESFSSQKQSAKSSFRNQTQDYEQITQEEIDQMRELKKSLQNSQVGKSFQSASKPEEQVLQMLHEQSQSDSSQSHNIYDNQSNNQSYLSNNQIDEDQEEVKSFTNSPVKQQIKFKIGSQENSFLDFAQNSFNKTLSRQVSNDKLLLTPSALFSKQKVSRNSNLAVKRQNSQNLTMFPIKMQPTTPGKGNQTSRNSITGFKSTIGLNTANQGGITSRHSSRRGSDFSDASLQDPFQKAINYKAVVESDQIDKMLEEFVRTHKIKVPIAYIDESKYLFGTKLINAQIINGVLMVRVGGGFMELAEYVEKHSAKEIFKLRTMMSRDRVKLKKITDELIEKYKIKKFT